MIYKKSICFLAALTVSMGLQAMEAPESNDYGLGLKLEGGRERLEALKAHPKHIAFKTAVVDLPTTVDLISQCSPIRNQKKLGSCTSFAGSGLVEFLLKKSGKPIVERSELFLYYNERKIEGSLGQEDPGANMDTIIKATHDYGSCPGDLWSYDDYLTKYRQEPTSVCYESAKQVEDLDDFNHTIIDQDLVTMKTVLAQEQPFVIGVGVYQSFQTAETKRTGTIPMPDVNSEKLLGGHAIMVVGYNDETQRFIFRNSWDTTWGNGGYGTLPYQYVVDSNLTQGLFTMYKLGAEQKAAAQRGSYCTLI